MDCSGMPSVPRDGAPSRILRQARRQRQRAARHRNDFQQCELTERITKLALDIDEKNKEIENLKTVNFEKNKEIEDLKIANSVLQDELLARVSAADTLERKLDDIESIHDKMLAEKDLVISKLRSEIAAGPPSFVCSCWQDYAVPCPEPVPAAIVCFIQRNWRMRHYLRKLRGELQGVSRKVVEAHGANAMSRSLLAGIRTMSRRSLLVRLGGDELPKCAGEVLELEEMIKIFADELVVKVLSGLPNHRASTS